MFLYKRNIWLMLDNLILSQKIHPRLINVETMLIVNVDQRCFNADIWLEMKVKSTYILTLFQRWQNNIETTMMELRRFNVDEPTLFQCYNLVENESWTDVYRRCFNVDKTTLKELRRFNVDEPMLFQCWYLVEWEIWVKACSWTLRKQYWNNFINIYCTDVH